VIHDGSWRLLAAASVLSLLPGIALVRAPWSTVPAFSLGFWMLSWFAFPGGGSGRTRFVAAAVILFTGLALLRGLQPRLWSRVTAAGWAAAAASLLALAPWLRVPVPAAPDLSFDAAAVRAVTWRDAIPASFEPLVPGQRFPTGDLGFQLLAADLAARGGGAPHRAAYLAQRLGVALLLLAVGYALARVARIASGAAVLAAIGACLALDLVRARLSLRGSADMQAAFLVFAAALLFVRTTRAATVAGLFFLACGCATAPRAGSLITAALLAIGIFAVARAVCIPAVVERARFAPAAAALLALQCLTAMALPQPAFPGAFAVSAAVVEAAVSPLALVCADAAEARWLPGVAGRAVNPPPRAVGDGATRRLTRPCTHAYETLVRAAPARR
jgi:hypothetical protein